MPLYCYFVQKQLADHPATGGGRREAPRQNQIADPAADQEQRLKQRPFRARDLNRGTPATSTAGGEKHSPRESEAPPATSTATPAKHSPAADPPGRRRGLLGITGCEMNGCFTHVAGEFLRTCTGPLSRP